MGAGLFELFFDRGLRGAQLVLGLSTARDLGFFLDEQLAELANIARDEHDAIRIGREIVAHLDWKKATHATRRVIEPPKYAAEDLLGIASPDIKVPFDSR